VPPDAASAVAHPQRYGPGRLVFTLAALGIVGLGIIVAEVARRPVVPASRFDVAPATRGDLRPVVRARARLAPAMVWHLRAATAGRVDRVLVSAGDVVGVGTVLATLERNSLSTEKRRADAWLARAEAAATETQMTMTRALQGLDDRGEDFPEDDSRLTEEQASAVIAYARHAAATAEVAARQATLVLADAKLRAATVKAEAAGVVSAISVEPGSFVAVGDALFTISDARRPLRAVVRVGDSDVGRIRMGQRARLTADGFPGRVFQATVVDEPLFSSLDAAQGGFPVGLVVDKDVGSLMAGMSVDAEIDTGSVSHILRVPAAALVFVPAGAANADSSLPAVWTVRNGEALRIPVVVGVREENLIEVRGDGLYEGAPVIVSERGGQP
jgi:HlyD family secretion protein